MGLGRHEFQHRWVTWNQSFDTLETIRSKVFGQTWVLVSALAEPQFAQIWRRIPPSRVPWLCSEHSNGLLLQAGMEARFTLRRDSVRFVAAGPGLSTEWEIMAPAL